LPEWLFELVNGQQFDDLELFAAAGVATFTSSPTCDSKARGRLRSGGDQAFSTSASSLLTSLYSMRTSFWVSMTTILEPKPERSVECCQIQHAQVPMRFFN